jgi:hypothetical protein
MRKFVVGLFVVTALAVVGLTVATNFANPGTVRTPEPAPSADNGFVNATQGVTSNAGSGLPGSLIYTLSENDRMQTDAQRTASLSAVVSVESPYGFGNAVVLHPAGWAVTCAHIVGAANSVSVTYDELDRALIVRADVVAVYRDRDLALLHLQSEREWQILPLTPNRNISIGGEAFLLRRNDVIQSGLVTDLLFFNSFIMGPDDTLLKSGFVVEADIPFFSGSAGSALINNAGEVMGIAVFGDDTGLTALSSDAVIDFLDYHLEYLRIKYEPFDMPYFTPRPTVTRTAPTPTADNMYIPDDDPYDNGFAPPGLPTPAAPPTAASPASPVTPGSTPLPTASPSLADAYQNALRNAMDDDGYVMDSATRTFITNNSRRLAASGNNDAVLWWYEQAEYVRHVSEDFLQGYRNRPLRFSLPEQNAIRWSFSQNGIRYTVLEANDGLTEYIVLYQGEVGRPANGHEYEVSGYMAAIQPFGGTLRGVVIAGIIE